VTDTSPPADNADHGIWLLRDSAAVFGQIERLIAVGIGALLSLAALALAGALTIAWDGLVQWPQIRSLFRIVDRLLFALMIIEILHTVRASIQTHRLACEPFLIVGMIATIRRILLVTLETSDQGPAGQTGVGTAPSFEHATVELGVLAILTLVLAVSLYLSRRTRDQSSGSQRCAGGGL
jgi:uncharacterized membrane protein (DUF373 family)